MKHWMTSLLCTGVMLALPLGAFADTLAFGKNKISKTVSGSIVRGETKQYMLGGIMGKNMSVAITSTEDNAVITVEYAEKKGHWKALPGAEEGADAHAWYGVLPPSEKNQYRITVAATRGNASYDLFVGLPETYLPWEGSNLRPDNPDLEGSNVRPDNPDLPKANQ